MQRVSCVVPDLLSALPQAALRGYLRLSCLLASGDRRAEGNLSVVAVFSSALSLRGSNAGCSLTEDPVLVGGLSSQLRLVLMRFPVISCGPSHLCTQSSIKLPFDDLIRGPSASCQTLNDTLSPLFVI